MKSSVPRITSMKLIKIHYFYQEYGELYTALVS